MIRFEQALAGDAIATGALLRNRDRRYPAAYRLARIEESDLAQVLALHRRVIDGLPDPSLAARETDEFFAAHVDDVGQLFGAWVDGRLAGYAVLGLPTGTSYNFGVALRLVELDRVAHLDGCAVHPEFRGNGLQRRFTELRISKALSLGKLHLCSTVAPRNRPSAACLFAARLRGKALERMFGGHLRLLLHRHAERGPRWVPASERMVDAADERALRAAFAGGYWARGVSRRGDGRCCIRLARPSAGALPSR